MKILVTGGAGFIGSHLVEALTERHNISVIDNLSNSTLENIRPVLDKITFLEIDYDNISENFLSKHEMVLHLASSVGVLNTINNPEEIKKDVECSCRLIDKAKRSGVKSFIFTSSSEIYGDKTKKMHEEDIPRPVSTYGKAKVKIEEHLQASYDKDQYLILRLFNVYGTRQKSGPFGFVMNTFIEKAVRHESLPIIGSGAQTRDFTQVQDIVNLILMLISNRDVPYNIVNIGTGVSTSILELAHNINKIVGNDNVTYIEKRAYEIEHRTADNKRIKDLTDYEFCSLDEGLRKLIDSHLLDLKKISP
ncbi:NAD-dependent epimerase/dehydratase family protein [Candidatus Woesearchaeota archaeon]|nr:NAD-dependent epimerase/dehydratase family protein [Candidatus Woesearchaeota archaeon]